jgi:hypothetical protein
MYVSSAINLYRSSNSGNTFTGIASGLPGRTITSIAVHPDSANTVLVSFSGFGAGKVYKTSTGGSSWINISGNLPDTPVNDILIYYPGVPTSIYYAATDVGIFFSNDYGITWTELAGGLPNTVILHLDYHQSTNKLRAGTHGRGVWETSNPVGIINYYNNKPDKFSLGQNYPNPFNPVTFISYRVSRAGNVRLSVFDILGREIKSIINGHQKEGTYTVQFDGTGIGSGIYIYRLETGNYSESKKMIFIK